MIEKGSSWGTPYEGELSAIPVARRDAEVIRAVDSGADLVYLRGGDMYRSLGSPSGVAETPTMLPIDLLEIRIDQRAYRAFAHLVLRGSGWSGECAVLMNAPLWRTFRLGPRAHPNDGLADLTIGQLGLRERMLARGRAPLGTHLPHPKLTTRRASAGQVEVRRDQPIWIDDVRVGRGHSFEFAVLPDAVSIVIW